MYIYKSKDQPGKVANPVCGELNRVNEYFPVPILALIISSRLNNLFSRDGFGSSVPRQPAHLHTQAELLGDHYVSEFFRSTSSSNALAEFMFAELSDPMAGGLTADPIYMIVSYIEGLHCDIEFYVKEFD